MPSRKASLREGEIDHQFDFVISCLDGTVAIDCRPPQAKDVGGWHRARGAGALPSARR